jgi:hypothetical protein
VVVGATVVVVVGLGRGRVVVVTGRVVGGAVTGTVTTGGNVVGTTTGIVVVGGTKQLGIPNSSGRLSPVFMPMILIGSH